MACPYFFPTRKSNGLYWPFPQRLPLGAGFEGSCAAGTESVPSAEELRDFCNVGYAGRCSRLPSDRRGDVIRFSVAAEQDGLVTLRYVCERDHAPVEHGELHYELSSRRFRSAPADAILLRQAECYVEVYMERRAIGG
ncbi:MAG: hypothetical protein LAP21_20845 [Acidobacteriia bacterium]|nr:hypothetical protein [Terriglobia bacterium]